MEKTSRGAVVRADIGWSDVGSWSALWDIGKKDAAQNVTRGDVHLADASGCYIWGDSRLVVALGAKDLIIVETDDAVLVAARARARKSRTSCRGSTRLLAPSTSPIPACTGRGATTNRSMQESAFRSSASW